MPFPVRIGSKRAPWPADWRVGNIPAYLKTQQPGNVALYSKKEIPFENVSPQVWDYATSSPYKERDFPMRNLFMGIGETQQIGPNPTHRCKECLNVDWSLGFAHKGKNFRDLSPVSRGAVHGFIEGYHGGALTLFALCGRYVNRLNADDTWTQSDDLGLGKDALQAARFEGTGGAAFDGIYVANTGTKCRQYDGALWHDCALPATSIDVRREELWFGYLNTITKVEADPTVGGDFAASVTIGDASAKINWLTHVLDALVIFKENGVFTLDVDAGTGNIFVTDIFPDMAQRSSDNGRNAAVWLGQELFAPFGNALWRFEPQITFSQLVQLNANPVDLGLRASLDGIVMGKPVATAGHNDWHNYVALYNASTGHSYLGKYGTWVAPELAGGPGDVASKFIPAFHAATNYFPNAQITSMTIWGRAGENQRLIVGFEDGTIQAAWLPLNSPDEVAESVDNGGKCEFTTADGYWQWPRHNLGFEAITKLFRGFSAFGPVISDTNSIVQKYRVGTASGAYDQLPDAFTGSGDRHDIPDTVVGKEIDCQTYLVNASINSSPVQAGMDLHEQLRPSETFEHEGVFDCHAAIPGLDGALRLRNAPQLRDAINEQMEKFGAVSVMMEDGSTQSLIFYDHGENVTDSLQSTGFESELPFKAVQFSSEIELGTYRRLRNWTYRQLRQIRYRGLSGI